VRLLNALECAGTSGKRKMSALHSMAVRGSGANATDLSLLVRRLPARWAIRKNSLKLKQQHSLTLTR